MQNPPLQSQSNVRLISFTFSLHKKKKMASMLRAAKLPILSSKWAYFMVDKYFVTVKQATFSSTAKCLHNWWH